MFRVWTKRLRYFLTRFFLNLALKEYLLVEWSTTIKKVMNQYLKYEMTYLFTINYYDQIYSIKSKQELRV